MHMTVYLFEFLTICLTMYLIFKLYVRVCIWQCIFLNIWLFVWIFVYTFNDILDCMSYIVSECVRLNVWIFSHCVSEYMFNYVSHLCLTKSLTVNLTIYWYLYLTRCLDICWWQYICLYVSLCVWLCSLWVNLNNLEYIWVSVIFCIKLCVTVTT